MEEETAEQAKNSQTDNVKGKADHLAPWQFKKGQSGNPSGRKGGKSLKEYAKEMIANMTDEERQEYLQGISKRIIWEMAEGKAESKTDITSGGEAIPVLVKFLDGK